MKQSQISIDQMVPKQKASSILFESKFLLLWLTLLASSLSVSFFLFTTNWYVVDYLELEKMLGLVFFASALPRLLFMLIGGAIADRMSKPWIMFISDVSKGLLLIGVVALLIFDVLSIWLLIALAFIFGILDAFFWPASGSMLPTLVKKDQLTRANSMIDMTKQSSTIIGPLLATLLLGSGGYATVFAFTALLLLAAGAIDIIIKNKTNHQDNELEPSSNKKTSMFQSIKEGFLYVKQSTFLMSLMSATILLNLFFVGPFTVGMPLFAKNVLSGTETTYSILYGALAAGMLVGSLCIGMLNIRRKRGLISVLSIMCLALFFLLLSLSNTLWVSLPIVVLMGAAIACANVPLAAVIQHYTENEYLGRVMSLVSFSSMGLVPLSYLFTSTLLSFNILIETIMLVSSSILCCITFFIIVKAKSLREVD
jgi:MFS family permease